MPKAPKRPTWDQYFMDVAYVARTRSSCIRLQVGAVLVREKRILATGYSGTPMGIKNCDEGGCERCQKRDKGILKAGEQKDKCICVHAEQNVLLQSAYHGISSKGSTLYCTVMPCSNCAKLIINAGITQIIVDQEYSDADGHKLLKLSGIKVRRLKKA